MVQPWRERLWILFPLGPQLRLLAGHVFMQHRFFFFLIFSRQQRYDGTPLHAEMALFSAALVLGVYVASMPEQGM
jgi:hypothetical protein